MSTPRSQDGVPRLRMQALLPTDPPTPPHCYPPTASRVSPHPPSCLHALHPFLAPWQGGRSSLCPHLSPPHILSPLGWFHWGAGEGDVQVATRSPSSPWRPEEHPQAQTYRASQRAIHTPTSTFGPRPKRGAVALPLGSLRTVGSSPAGTLQTC